MGRGDNGHEEGLVILAWSPGIAVDKHFIAEIEKEWNFLAATEEKEPAELRLPSDRIKICTSLTSQMFYRRMAVKNHCDPIHTMVFAVCDDHLQAAYSVGLHAVRMHTNSGYAHFGGNAPCSVYEGPPKSNGQWLTVGEAISRILGSYAPYAPTPQELMDMPLPSALRLQ